MISSIGWLLVLLFLKETLVKVKTSEEIPLLHVQEEVTFKNTLTSPILLICAVASLSAFEMLFYEGKY
jgi:hypothetical protein